MDKAESLVGGDNATVGGPQGESAPLAGMSAEPVPVDAPGEAPAPAAPDVRTDTLSPPVPPPRDDIAQLLNGAVERITAALQARARTETFHQELITKLHNDLQEQVNRSAVLPVVTGMIRLQEEMEKVAEHLRASPGALTPERLLQQFAEFAEDIGLLLEQAGVVRFADEAMGDEFNGSRQTVLGRDPTNDPALNHRISVRVRPGADFGKTLLRREAVRVYVLEPDPPAPKEIPTDQP